MGGIIGNIGFGLTVLGINIKIGQWEWQLFRRPDIYVTTLKLRTLLGTSTDLVNICGCLQYIHLLHIPFSLTTYKY